MADGDRIEHMTGNESSDRGAAVPVSLEEAPRGVVGEARLDGLTIERIEVVPLRVPLARVFSGSYYRMSQRATVITRVHTREGIVGEAYTGDEDAALDQILAIVRNEIEPRLIGEDAFQVERCWQLARPGDVRHPARPAARPRRLRRRRHGDLGRHRQGARPASVAALGRLPAAHPDDRDRRLLRAVARRGRARDGGVSRRRTRRLQVQGRRSRSRRGCRAGARRARGRRRAGSC